MRKKEEFKRTFLYKNVVAEDEMKLSLNLGLKQLKEIESLLHEAGIKIDNEVLSNCIFIKRVEKRGKEIEHKYLGAGSYNKYYQVETAWENAGALEKHFEELERKLSDNGIPSDGLKAKRDALFEDILKFAKINDKYGRKQILFECTEVVDDKIILKQDFQEIIDKYSSVYAESEAAEQIMKEHEKLASIINDFIETNLNGDVFDIEDLFQTDSRTGKIIPRMFNYNLYVNE